MHRELCVLAIALSTSCIVAPLSLTEGAQITCDDDAECPAGLFCAEAVHRCSGGGPCIAEGTEDPVGDGTACGDGHHCVDGACVEPFCGDGIVTFPAEQCDPRHDPDCSAQCSVPFCGDGLVDAPETCDDNAPTCVSCLFSCSEVGHSDCNLSADDACECNATQIIDTLGTLVTAAAMLGDRVVYATTQSGLDDNDVVVVDGDDQQTLLQGLSFAHVVRHRDEVLLARSDGDSSVIEALLPTRRTILQTDDIIFQLTSNDDALIASVVGGLFLVDTDAGSLRPLADVCGRFVPTPTIVCDDNAVVCDDEGAVTRVDLDSGDTTVLGVENADFLPFCDGADVFWHDTSRVIHVGDGGDAALFASIVGRSSQVRPQFRSLVRGQHFLLSMLSDDIADAVTFSYDLGNGTFSVPIAGGILDVKDNDVLAFSFRQRQLLRVSLVGER